MDYISKKNQIIKHINSGYQFKNYDHSADLSHTLTSAVIGTNQVLTNFLSIGFQENNETVSRSFIIFENGLNPKNGTITKNSNAYIFHNKGILS